MKEKPLAVFIAGPTASGKSSVAEKLALQINAEIISADSMQVYRGMDILSAKPTPEQRKAVPHYLVDILGPTEQYSAAIFREKALKAMQDITGRGKIPLIVGGTGLYVKALTRGLFSDKGKDEQLRKELEKEAKHKGKEHLYERLKQVDPEAAQKIHPNDLRRLVRSLEAYEVNNMTITQLKGNNEGLDKKYDFKMFAINRDRRELYKRIELRVDKMFEDGLVDEVKNLLKLPLSHTAQQAIGIKQISAYLKKEYTLDKAKELIKRDTRRFAKRQLTWFRQEKDINWINAEEGSSGEEICATITAAIT